MEYATDENVPVYCTAIEQWSAVFRVGVTPAGPEPTSAQILAAIEASSLAVQAKVEAIAINVNLLRADQHKVVERSNENGEPGDRT